MTFSRFHIVLGESPIHGLGVFATKNFKKGEIIEVCPIINVIGNEEAILLAKSAEVGEFGATHSPSDMVPSTITLTNQERPSRLWLGGLSKREPKFS